MHVAASLQFTKQLVIFGSYKRAVEAPDCFDNRSGFRFTVHNKHMRGFKIKSSQASTFSFTSSAVDMQSSSTEQTVALLEIITHENCKSKFCLDEEDKDAKQTNCPVCKVHNNGGCRTLWS